MTVVIIISQYLAGGSENLSSKIRIKHNIAQGTLDTSDTVTPPSLKYSQPGLTDDWVASSQQGSGYKSELHAKKNSLQKFVA